MQLASANDSPGRLGRRQSGQVLISTSIAIFVLLGFAGLAADVGYLEHVKRRMQTAADAGALAGAQVLATAGSSPCMSPTTSAKATTAAQTDSALNGFTNSSNNVTVTVNCPPASGVYAGNNSAVEVIVKQTNQPSFFMAALGYSKATVAARAVGHLSTADPCLVTLAPSGVGINMTGSGTVSLGCSAFVDSTASNAVNLTGSPTLTATAVDVAATAPGFSITGSGSITPSVDAGLVPLPDPLGGLPSPASATCGPATSATVGSGTGTYTGSANPVSIIGSATVTMNPGVYCGGINITGSDAVTFTPGTYIIAGGGLNATGSPSLTGTGGVFFYFTGTGGTPSIPGETAYGGPNLTGSGPMNFNAPSSGTYQGILFDSDRTVATSPLSMTGSSSATLNGVLYFPRSDVTLTGSGGIGGGFDALIANKVTLTGSGTITFSTTAIPGGSPIHRAVLGE